MLEWFSQNFEDPAVRTPYESAEGGYQWIWGGPYEARDELYSKFGDLISESLLEEVVEEIEREGLTDWAPVSSPDDYDPPEPPDEPPSLDIFLDEPSANYGMPAEQAARAKAQAALDDLQKMLDEPRPVGIGHNRPPEDIEPEELKEVRTAVGELKVEFGKQSPAISFVKKWAKPLRDALIACGKWGANKLDKGADAAVKVIGGGVGTWMLSQCIPGLHNAFSAIVDWLETAAKTITGN
jgi:hypothetical protein